MQASPIPPDEQARLAALRELCILDTPPDASFDRVGRLAQALFGVPIALTVLVDAERQWFKSGLGLNVTETSRDVSFCSYTIQQDQVLIIPDAASDPRFADNPLVVGRPYIRFYAGVPLTSSAGYRVGAFCIIDTVPRTLDDQQISRLQDLARIVNDEFNNKRLNEITSLYREEQDRLNETKTLLQLVANNAPGMLGYWNADLRCTFANDAYVQWFGLRPEQIIGMHIRDLLGETVFAKNLPYIHAALDGKDQEFERTLSKPDKEIGHTLARYIPHRVDGKVTGFFVQVSDITVVKLAYQQLEASRTQLASVLSAIPDTVFTHRYDGQIIDIHAVASDDLHLPREQILNRPLDEVFPASVAQQFIEVFAAAKQTWTVQEVSYSLQHNGKERYFEARAVATPHQECIAIVRDITERELNRKSRERYTAQLSDRLKLTESAVRDREASLALAADAASLGYWYLDCETEQVFPSEQWCRQRGYTVQPTFPVAAMINCGHPEDRAGIAGIRERLLPEQPFFEFTYRIVLLDGEVRWMTSRGRGEFDGAGKLVMVRGLSIDTSNIKQAELDLAQKQQEVTYLSRLATMGELSGAFAHELNQPLTAILSNAQAARRFLAKGELDELEDILTDIIEDDKRADEIIRRLRTMFDKSPAIYQLVNVNRMIMEVIHMLSSDLINHNVAVRTELRSSTPWVLADLVQMQQVMINLIKNSCDAMEDVKAPHNEIMISTDIDSEGQVHIRVVDQGGGISTDIAEQMFSPFFSTKVTGMGLGLSICRNIVEGASGKLWAENNAVCGATFHLCLPSAEKKEAL
ncbi:PAS domain-containing protein [Pseudomonas sp.]|uniref:PAS domain-containing protein n=1 Tax=Pseudomonas sp. TaxID=306 RepID=UPI00260DBC11|nr:PAS domain-containing protein [Pseudomonas sp.]